MRSSQYIHIFNIAQIHFWLLKIGRFVSTKCPALGPSLTLIAGHRQYKFFFINIFEWWSIAEREEILREIKFFKFFNIIEVLGDYIRVINHTSPTPSHLLGIIDLSSPPPLKPVGTRWDPF